MCAHACIANENEARTDLTQPGIRCAAQPVSRPGGTANGQLQVVPLRVKVVGLVSLLVQVPWNPNWTLPPGAMVAL